jgi:ABC-type multidrug transport system ATPase subunit
MTVLHLHGVTKGWSRPVLRDVHLAVGPGEVAAVVGGNGAGKSTLLRIAAGLSRPDAGRVTGRPRPVGYVPDRFTANQHMSALGYLTHLGRVRGLDRATAHDRAGWLLERFVLVGGSGSALRMLSKGNTQKVALAQAFLIRPRLLVLDEPWAGLDAPAQRVLGELIAEVATTGAAVLFTDHRLELVTATATVVHHLIDGRIA